jgi:hypothetical protein
LVVPTTSSTALSAVQRPQKRPRHQDADEACLAASKCSEVIRGARTRPVEVDVSESSCLGSALESDLASPDDAEMTDYWSACGELTSSSCSTSPDVSMKR